VIRASDGWFKSPMPRKGKDETFDELVVGLQMNRTYASTQWWNFRQGLWYSVLLRQLLWDCWRAIDFIAEGSMGSVLCPLFTGLLSMRFSPLPDSSPESINDSNDQLHSRHAAYSHSVAVAIDKG
jgi:hypothetical protein